MAQYDTEAGSQVNLHKKFAPQSFWAWF